MLVSKRPKVSQSKVLSSQLARYVVAWMISANGSGAAKQISVLAAYGQGAVYHLQNLKRCCSFFHFNRCYFRFHPR
jgi:hypothetical protein